MLTVALSTAFGSISLAIIICTLRLLRGPDPADRVLAFDTLYINTIALLTVMGMHQSTSEYFEAALAIATIGFVATAALARYLTHVNVGE
jgi:multicomponent K+:H+ antiporter subunit F